MDQQVAPLKYLWKIYFPSAHRLIYPAFFDLKIALNMETKK